MAETTDSIAHFRNSLCRDTPSPLSYHIPLYRKGYETCDFVVTSTWTEDCVAFISAKGRYPCR